ncbi:MAG: YbjN domain-containing protein [Myxococcales bacterium]|nr:YbjN domain-containing protein [Myxococcales bacterium]
MGRILETCAEMLTQQGWSFERSDGRDALITSVRGDAASYRIIFDVKEESEQAVLYVVSPTNVPEGKRQAACEFVARANYGLIIGNFEHDLSDGEIRYKVSVDVEGSKLTVPMAKNMLGCGIAMMERYYSGLMAIAFAETKPEEAVASCEK